MEDRKLDTIDIREFRKQFHKHAYEKSQKELNSKTSGTIAEIFSPAQRSNTHEQYKPVRTLHDSGVKTASKLIQELLGFDDINDFLIPDKTYQIPATSYPEVRDKHLAYQASTEKAPISSSDSEELIDWKTAYHLAEDFIDLFSPWRGRFKVLTKRGWTYKERKLPFSAICNAIQGRSTLAFFSPVNTSLLGIDIDDHTTSPFAGQISANCIDTYKQVIMKLACPPSLVCKSPRGLHLFYLLTNRMHCRNLHLLARDLLQNENLELLPSRRNTIRIPSVPNIRDSSTLEPLSPDHLHCSDWHSLPRYSPETLFGSHWKDRLHRLIKERLNRKRGIADTNTDSSSKNIHEPSLSLRLLEREVLPLQNGDTYRPVFKLIIACIREGMNRDEIINYLNHLLELSPSYTGDLKTKPKILADRVDHILTDSATFCGETIEYNPAILTDLQPVIDHLASSHPFAPQRKKTIKQFIKKLILWKSFNDRIIQDFEETAKFEELYPFYRKNRREGYYPLPSSLLKRWHPKYYALVNWLKEIEVLQESPYPYSKSAHICKYYAISFEHLDP